MDDPEYRQSRPYSNEKTITDERDEDTGVTASADIAAADILSDIDELYIEIGEKFYYNDKDGYSELFEEIDQKFKLLHALNYDETSATSANSNDNSDETDTLKWSARLAIGIVSVLMMASISWFFGLFSGDSFVLFFFILSVASLIGVQGIHMFLTGKGHGRWNDIGIRWDEYNEFAIPRIASLAGAFIWLSAIVCSIGISVLLNTIILGIIILACGVLLMMVPHFITRDGLIQYRLKEPICPRIRTQVIAIIITIILIGGGMMLSSYATGSSTDISIDLEGDSFTINNLFDSYTIRYEDVISTHIEEDYDRGEMKSGYVTLKSSGGVFKNYIGEYIWPHTTNP